MSSFSASEDPGAEEIMFSQAEKAAIPNGREVSSKEGPRGEPEDVLSAPESDVVSESEMPYADEMFLGPPAAKGSQEQRSRSDSPGSREDAWSRGSETEDEEARLRELPSDPEDAAEELPAPFAAGFPGIRSRRPLDEYPASAAADFGERFAHRLRWAHAVNSRRRLRGALATGCHFLEADVSVGPLEASQVAADTNPRVSKGSQEGGARSGRSRRASHGSSSHELSTSVQTSAGDPVIMAHYPTELSSDLSLEGFVAAVLRHNERVVDMETAEVQAESHPEALAGIDGPPGSGASSALSPGRAARRAAREERRRRRAAEQASPRDEVYGDDAPEPGDDVIFEAAESKCARASPFSAPRVDEVASAGASPEVTPKFPGADHAAVGSCSEAATFAQELDQELDKEAARNKGGGLIASCVGSRRDAPRRMEGDRPTRKGVKLDFKRAEAVEPCIRYLRDSGIAKKLGGHLWLNADIFAGPGALMSPLDAKVFTGLCAEALPEAVLSLSWGSSVMSTTRMYTDDMVVKMLELCMSPIIQRHFPSSSSGPALASLDQPEVSPDDFPSSVPKAMDAVDGDGDGMGCQEAAARRQAASQFLNATRDAGQIYLTPAAVCRHITFPVAAEYAVTSAVPLRKLLDAVPGSSLTIFSGVGSFGITPAAVQEMIATYGKGRIFLDLKLSKAWRTCSRGSCVLQ